MAAPSFRVEVKGIAELQSKFKSLGDKMGTILEMAVAAGAVVVTNEAQNNASRGHPSYLKRQTGTLVRSIQPHVVSASNTRVEMAVGSSLEYSRIHEFGGTISAKNGGKLTFKTEDGAWHQVTSVHIPPRPYLRPALDENVAEIEAAVAKQLMVVLGGI